MSSSFFELLPITNRVELTADSFSLTLTVPPNLKKDFSFLPGQFLTIAREFDVNETLRRSYSICSSAQDFLHAGQISVGIKRVAGGQFSEPAFEQLKVGDRLAVMRPSGRFTLTSNEASADLHHVAFAAGSGVTPILSIMDSVLRQSSKSRFTLVYGNRASDQVMFLDTIEGFKNQYLDRVRLVHILSQEPQEMPLFNGRIDASKVQLLLAGLIPANTIDLAWICGPDSLIEQTEQALLEAGVSSDKIRSERFGEPSKTKQVKPAITSEKTAQLVVMLDGKSKTLAFPYSGTSLLDVALQAGMDLPYACKGGVCCTCRAKIMSGEVHMEKNYTLEAWEVQKGFVLTCQCSPLTEQVTVSFDER
jgi:ring-1,2-phenylacetyl-CoA epoxidase subunit PaaE